MNHPSRRDPRNQIAAGSFLGLTSTAGWWSAARTEGLWSGDYGADPGPGLLPLIILTILSLGALMLLVGGVAGVARTSFATGYLTVLRKHTLAPALFVGSLLVYVAAIPGIGFVPASLVFSFAWMTILGFRTVDGSRRSLLLNTLGGTLAGVGLVYFVFVYLIRVPLQ